MLTVRNLISENPFMQEENQFFFRNKMLDLPIQRIKEESDPVSSLDIRIGKVVQAALLTLQISLRLAITVFISTQIGPLFWNMAAIGTITGVVIGAVVGLQHSDILTLQDRFIYQSHLYACYKSRIKLLEPALEVGYWLVAYKIELLSLKVLPIFLGSVSLVFTTFLYSSDLSYSLSRSLKNSILPHLV